MKKIIQILSFVIFSLAFAQTKANNNTGGDPITCPPNITIRCCQDYNDTNITGHPGVINYVFNNYSYADSVGIDECRVGKIRRTWTGYNEVGHFSCKQYITLQRTNIFNGQIIWPEDWSGTCEDVIPFNEPIYDVGFCDQVGHTFKDDTFRFDQNACIKILRNWKVLDWCVYHPNSYSTNGMYPHTQVLMIIDKIPPKIENCKNRIVKAMNSDCTANAVFTQSATDNNCGTNSGQKWIFEMDIHNNCKLDTTITINSANPNIPLSNLPTGTHLINWKVYDGCANVSTCTEKITVQDGKAPTLICYLSTSANLIQGDDSIRIPAKHFVKEAFDNCTPKNKIIFSFSQEKKDSFLTFDCDDVGFQFLRIYAIDQNGNSDYAFVLTRIQINEPCTNNSITGSFTNFGGKPLKDISLYLEGAGKTYEITKSETNGKFQIPYIEKGYLKPKLKFSPSSAFNAQINEDDIILIKDYLLGKIELDEIQKFAADFNSDGIISTKDLKLLRESYLNNTTLKLDNEVAKFYLKDENNVFIQVENITDFSKFLDIKCAIKGKISNASLSAN
jgi:hypothetical protein